MNLRSSMICAVIGLWMILSGFLLERLKVSLNFVIEKSLTEPDYDRWSETERALFIHSQKRDLPYDYFHSHVDFEFLFAFPAFQLKQMKWLVTFLGLLWFALLNGLALLVFYPMRESLNWILFLYSIIVILSILFYTAGYLLNLSEGAYQVTRKILNAGQSGIPAVLVYFVKKFDR